MHRLFVGLLLCAPIPAAFAQSVFNDGFEVPRDIARIDAARLLTQASFGPTLPEIERVADLGAAAWIDQQLALPASHHAPFLDQIRASGEDVYQNVRLESWFRNALWAPDQLRQRVAFALSEIFVISDRSALEGAPASMANYYDLLVDHAFGDYRELLEAVTLHPAMGVYLSMLGNQKPDDALNIRPDENYAREVMQLFSIGLVMLDTDGSIRDGDPATPGIQSIPTYDQQSIRGFAHVFTGWKWLECESARESRPWEWEYCYPSDQWLAQSGWRAPMRAVEWQHASGVKTLLSYHGVGGGDAIAVPDGGTAITDLGDALDTLALHPNVAPFISRQLIQRLVTSNPSPEYIARVAGVFNDDGNGSYGQLGAVVRAILLDPEARDERWRTSDSYGKLREPLLRRTHLWRALGAHSESGRFYPWEPERALGQAPLRSPSVFNFFNPNYQLPGEVQQRGLRSPEFQITTDTYIVSTSNSVASDVYWRHEGNQYLDPDEIRLTLAPEEQYADDPAALVARYDLLFMNGQMTDALRQILVEHVGAITSDDNADWRRQRVQDAIVLIITSPHYAVQR